MLEWFVKLFRISWRDPLILNWDRKEIFKLEVLYEIVIGLQTILGKLNDEPKGEIWLLDQHKQSQVLGATKVVQKAFGEKHGLSKNLMGLD